MIGLMYLFSTKQKKHFSSIEGRERGGQDGPPLNNSNVRIILNNFFFFFGGGGGLTLLRTRLRLLIILTSGKF